MEAVNFWLVHRKRSSCRGEQGRNDATACEWDKGQGTNNGAFSDGGHRVKDDGDEGVSSRQGAVAVVREVRVVAVEEVGVEAVAA